MSKAHTAIKDKAPFLHRANLKEFLRECIADDDYVFLVFSDGSKLIFERKANWRNDCLRVVAHAGV